MLIHKLARLLSALAIVTLLAAGCGGSATVDTGAEPDTVTDATDATDADAPDSDSDRTEPTAVAPAAEAEPTAEPATPAAEPTPRAETDDTNGQDQDPAATSDDDDDAVVLGNRDEAVAFIVSEGFVADDAECIADGAYQVFGTWDFADLDTDEEQDEQLEALLDACITVVPGPAAGSTPPGTDPELDALWIACDDGSASACDELYWSAPVDSDYEAFGLTCGGRAIDVCSDLLGDDSGDNSDSASSDIDGPAAGSEPPGTDAELDVLWIACVDGSAEACDDLFWQSPVGSDYEAFGLSCGGRGNGSCSEVIDGDRIDPVSDEIEGPAAGTPPPGTDAELDALWVACAGGSADACDDLFWQSPVDSDYEAFGFSCGGLTASAACSQVLDG